MNLNYIKANDPKWKTEDYEVKVTEFQPTFEKMRSLYEERIYINAVYDSIITQYDQCGTPYITSKHLVQASKCNENHYDFYLKKYNIRDLQRQLKTVHAARPEWVNEYDKYAFLYKHFVKNYEAMLNK